MSDTPPQFLAVGDGPHSRRIAYLRPDHAAATREPGIVWLCGLKSEMTSTKASAVAAWAAGQRLPCLRFDYSGHGQSDGKFEEGTVSRWLEDTRAVFTRLTEGPQVLVGSSMGGYLALLLGEDRSKQLLEESLRFYRELEDKQGVARTLPGWRSLHQATPWRSTPC